MTGCHRDLREYIQVLDAAVKLRTTKEAINKDTELMPLVCWQFRGRAADQRTGFPVISLHPDF